MTRPLYQAPDDWEVVTLEPRRDGQVIVEAASGSTPPTEQPEAWGGTIPWLTPKEIAGLNSSRFVALTERALTTVGLTQAGRLWPEMTVMLTKRAPVGLVALNAVPMATNQGFLNFRCGTTLLPEFLFYWFRANGPYLDAVANGSTYPELYVGDLFEFRIALPSIGEQRRIVQLLASLDDSIELRHRISEKFEAAAHALFKSWFVDFDPVRAKAEGRDPSLPGPIADLFPNHFEASDLGEVPAKWRVVSLPEIVDLNPTRQLKKGVPAAFVDMASMPQRGHAPERVVRRPMGSGMRFQNGDTLVARITPCLENGKTAYVDFLETGEVGWGSTEYIVLHPKPPLPTEFGYLLARLPGFRDFAIQRMTGTSGRQRVPADALQHYRLAAPPEAVARQFGELVGPLIARGSVALRECRTLGEIRDALLPRLVTGAIRVPDAERTLEAAPT